jgi:SAM-dependent methyltransferase
VENIPFIDNYFDLIVSRGSIFFWEDMAKGLSEAYRVLKNGGAAYIGGGTSRLMPRDQAEEFMRWARPRHRDSLPDWDQRTSPEYLHEMLKKAGITTYNLIKENGTWIEIKK